MLLSFLLSATFASAQVVVERQVVGSSGGAVLLGENVMYESTIGEPIIGTRQAGEYALTKGFHQPLAENSFLNISVQTKPSSCPNSSDGMAFIDDIIGCEPPYDIRWSNGIVASDTVARLLPGLYSVTIVSAFCEETVEFEVRPGPSENCLLKIFNAFTPNGDGKSDNWRIENIDLSEFRENKVEVFNRWGQPVFSAINYDNQEIVWNGKAENGLELQTGTYFYVIEAGGLTFKGYVELIR